jgi:hypothetical protein
MDFEREGLGKEALNGSKSNSRGNASGLELKCMKSIVTRLEKEIE